jgi:GNAT superfamily N-acetyltransferase
MKRLYVVPEARGRGIARVLAERIIAEARSEGYSRMSLDTLSSRMSGAIALYLSLGFETSEPYRFNPFEDALYFSLSLD